MRRLWLTPTLPKPQLKISLPGTRSLDAGPGRQIQTHRTTQICPHSGTSGGCTDRPLSCRSVSAGDLTSRHQSTSESPSAGRTCVGRAGSGGLPNCNPHVVTDNGVCMVVSCSSAVEVVDDDVSAGGVRVVNKASALLEVLASRGPQTVVQLAEATGEPRTTIYRLLATMQPMGWVEETTRRGNYVLGLRLVQLGRAAIEQGFARKLALPALRALRNETGLTVYLTVVRGLRAVCVERLDGREVLTYGLQFGGSLPLHAGAGPNVLLACSDPIVYERWRR